MKNGSYDNPMFSQGKLFYGSPSEVPSLLDPSLGATKGTRSGRVFLLKKPKDMTAKSDLLVSDVNMANANVDSHIVSPYARELDENGNVIVTKVNEDIRRVPFAEEPATSENTTLYRWKPDYGYKKVGDPESTYVVGNEIVDDAGNLNISVDDLLKQIKTEYPYTLNPEDLTNKGINGSTDLSEHLQAVVQSAQTYPLPKGVSRKEFVTSALYHDLGKVFGDFGHGTNSAVIASELNLPITRDAIKAVSRHMNQQEYFKTATQLEKALHAADVGRGMKYEELIEKYPYLKYDTPQITTESAANMTPKVNWDADNWFKTISGRSSYSSEEAAELASHVPEYRAIEQRLFNEGKLALNSNGDIIVVGSKMSPQEYIMRQSKAFQKMNTVEQFKNGSKIHIKKKNRGKFTDYCGGEVTQECIRKAKASGNPTLVKRATFADNARHFKHKSGGKAFVEGVNVLDSNPRIYKYQTKIKVSPRGVIKKETGGSFVNNALNFINSDTGQSIIGGVSNIIQGMSAKKKLNKAIDAQKKAIDEQYNVAKNNIDIGARKSQAQANLEYKKALSPGIHFGEIDLGQEENKLKQEAAAKATNDANVQRDQALANLNNQASQMSNEVSNNITGNIGGLLNGAFQLAGNYFSNKTSNNSTTVKPGYTYSKIASNNFSVPKTNFSVNMKL